MRKSQIEPRNLFVREAYPERLDDEVLRVWR